MSLKFSTFSINPLMPLFIDLHIDNALTPDIVSRCHVADKAIQEKYGVKYLQVLLNQPQGYLFCLAEGPDMESVVKVHQEAHGNIACNVLEITQSDFSALLNGTQKDSRDFTSQVDGSVDTGNRVILAMNIVGPSAHSLKVKDMAIPIFEQKNGRMSESLENDVVFSSCTSAIEACMALKERMAEQSLCCEVRFGISTGAPLTKEGNFFEEVRNTASYFAFLSAHGMVTVSSKARQLYRGNAQSIDSIVKTLNPSDEKFLTKVMRVLNQNWGNDTITIDWFSNAVDMSKSQLSRKLKLLSGLSPNDFIKEFRLRKSVELLNDNLNIAETTMAIGFSNPSYFTKCFRSRFGKTPSEYATD
jgi:AraC-like DNA-binding protein